MVYAIIHILTALTTFVTFMGIYWLVDRWFFKPSDTNGETRSTHFPWWIWLSFGIVGTFVMVISSYIKSGHLISGRFAVEMVLGQMLGAIVFGTLSSLIFKHIKTKSPLWVLLLFFPISKVCGPLLGAAIMVLLGYKPGTEAPIIM